VSSSIIRRSSTSSGQPWRDNGLLLSTERYAAAAKRLHVGPWPSRTILDRSRSTSNTLRFAQSTRDGREINFAYVPLTDTSGGRKRSDRKAARGERERPSPPAPPRSTRWSRLGSRLGSRQTSLSGNHSVRIGAAHPHALDITSTYRALGEALRLAGRLLPRRNGARKGRTCHCPAPGDAMSWPRAVDLR
jgi:hypothetical protein